MTRKEYGEVYFVFGKIEGKFPDMLPPHSSLLIWLESSGDGGDLDLHLRFC